MWGGAAQLPWGKPYLQDIKRTMLTNDPGYQEAKNWWENERERSESRDRELLELRAQLSSREAEFKRDFAQLDNEYSNLNSEYGRAINHFNHALSVRRVPSTEDHAQPSATKEHLEATPGTLRDREQREDPSGLGSEHDGEE
jgi:hypothetical protein